MSNRRLRQAGRQLRRKGRRWHGILGNHTGTVEVPERTGYFYVRMPQAGASNYAVAQFRSRGVPAYLNLPVQIEQDPLTGERFIASVDYQMVEYGSASDDDYDVPGYLEPHNDQHEFGGADQLDFLDTRQLYALRVQPTGNASEVLVQAGTYAIGGAFYFSPDSQTVDLSAYAPASDYTWCMLYIDRDATITARDVGQIYAETEGSAYRLGEPPTGTSAIAVVKVASGVAPDWEEIVDLRFAPRTPGGYTLIGNRDEDLDIDHISPKSSAWGGFFLFQQFVPHTTGSITRLAVQFAREYAGGTLTVHQGANGNATQIGSGQIPAVSADTSFVNPHWQEVVFDEPIDVEAGTTYTLMVSDYALLVCSVGDAYSDGRLGTNRSTLQDSSYDMLFRVWILAESDANPYVSLGPGGIHVHQGNITLSEGGLVDGVDVGGMHNEIQAAQHTLRMETYHLRRDVYQLRRQVQALARQFDLVLTKHAMTTEV